MAYHSKYTSAEVDALLDKIAEDNVGDIDSALSTTSENPVMNKVVTAELNKKATKDEVTTLEAGVNANKDLLETQGEKIQFLDQSKPNTTGYYPLLHVGTADDLAGRGESVPASFGFRASGGKSIKDGRAYIKRIKGNSVVWNQQVQHESRTEGSCSSAWDGDVITINGVSPKGYYSIMRNKIPCVLNEKFLIIAEEVANPNNLSFSVGLLNAVQGRATLGGGNTFSAVIGNSITTVESGFGIDKFGGAGTDLTGIRFKVRVINLTKMFQAGNEPTTIEEYNARKPIVEDEYAYNEGEVIHMTAEGIKSVGDNAWDEEWVAGRLNTDTGQPNFGNNGITSKNYIRVLPNETYYCGYNAAPIFAMFYDAEYNLILQVSGSNNFINIRNRQFTTPANAVYMRFYVADNNITTYNHDIMISLVHSGWKQDTDAGYQPYWQDILPLPIISKYFPDGMKSAGSAHDEIRFNKASGKWEKVVRIGEVDMGALSWVYDTNNLFFRVEVPKSFTRLPFYSNNLVCVKYFVNTTSKNPSTWLDKEMALYNGAAYPLLGIKDSAYTDAASFKAAMQGVILYYELAEPIVTELDAEDQNFRDYYNVADFGTEQSQSNVPSANFSADIIYQFNAVDMIREHEIEITELQKVIATMQAQLASLTSNNE